MSIYTRRSVAQHSMRQGSDRATTYLIGWKLIVASPDTIRLRKICEFSVGHMAAMSSFRVFGHRTTEDLLTTAALHTLPRCAHQIIRHKPCALPDGTFG